MMKATFSFLLASFSISLAPAQHTATGKLDSLFTALEKNNKAIGSVAIRQNGQLVYSRATGFSHFKDDKPVPPTTGTVYRLGSISKMYTAALIFQLIEKGRLNFEQKLADFFPTIPNADKITIRHMLGHTSGIYSVTDDSTYEKWYTTPVTPEAMIAKIAGHSPSFEPGSKKRYCNSNYILLGYIIEKLSGESLDVNIRKNINTLTGATHTRYGSVINPQNGEAHSFSFDKGKWNQQPETHMSVPHGAGAFVTTASEVALFAEKYAEGQLLSKQWTDTVMNVQKQLGYGIIRYMLPDGKKGLGHNGAIDGFNTSVMYCPDNKTSIAFLSNGINYSVDDIVLSAYKIVNNLPYKIPSFTVIELPEAELKKFHGTYGSSQIPLKITVTNKGTTLIIQATGQPEIEMETVSATGFTNGRIGADIEFVPTKEGVITELILKQGGAEILFKKE